MHSHESYMPIAETVVRWMEQEGFRGYDPYDGCNTRYHGLTRFRSSRLALTYFNKFSPINLRPLFGIEKRSNLYGLALTTSGLLRMPMTKARAAVVRQFVDQLIGQSLKPKYGYHCWSGNGMVVQTTGGLHFPDVPGVVGTEQCTTALLDVLRAGHGEESLRGVVADARDFCLNVLVERSDNGVFFRYKPDTPPHMLTFNASMRAASLVLEVNAFLGSDVGNDAARKSIDYMLDFQHADGSWNYSIDLRTGRQKVQIDFHQGFMLEGLMARLHRLGHDERTAAALHAGLAYYRNVQFLPSGQCHYRYPRLWPANIHNQAQGMITFARAEAFVPGSLPFAHIVAKWTLDNMYDAPGRFHYLRYRWFSNRIPYFRWSQAWMLYALTLLASLDRPVAARVPTGAEVPA